MKIWPPKAMSNPFHRVAPAISFRPDQIIVVYLHNCSKRPLRIGQHFPRNNCRVCVLRADLDRTKSSARLAMRASSRKRRPTSRTRPIRRARHHQTISYRPPCAKPTSWGRHLATNCSKQLLRGHNHFPEKLIPHNDHQKVLACEPLPSMATGIIFTRLALCRRPRRGT